MAGQTIEGDPSTISKWSTNSLQLDLKGLLIISDILKVDIKGSIIIEYEQYIMSQGV